MSALPRLTIAFSTGDSTEHACQEAQRLADLLNVYVEFDFNGVSCVAVPEGDAEILCRRTQEQVALDRDLRRYAYSTRPWRP